MKNPYIVMGSIIAVLIVGLVVLYKINQQPRPTAVESITEQSLIGIDSYQTHPGAKVTLVEFGDFQCPACAAASPIIKKVLESYSDNPNVNFVFRNFPLPMHANAIISSQAAEAAGVQGKYWEMFDKLYSSQKEWSEIRNPLPIFIGYATVLGLDIEKFRADIEGNVHYKKIKQDQKDGVAIGIQATPTFFLNGEKIVGVPNATELTGKIDALLK